MAADDRLDLPVLVTYQTKGSRDLLEGAALVARTVVVPLEAPPQGPGLHVLEVRLLGSPAVLLLHATPDGQPTAAGHPLRLTPWTSSTVASPAPAAPAPARAEWLETNPFRNVSKEAVVVEKPQPQLAVRPDLMPSAIAENTEIAPVIGAPSAQGRAIAISRHGEEARRMAPLVQEIIQTTDPAAFHRLVAPLEREIKELMAGASANHLWRLCSALDVIAKEGTPRSPIAASLLKLFRDPKLLAPIAERALDSFQDRDGAARKVLVLADRAGAFALYFARLHAGTFEVRERFVSSLKDIGPEAIPMLKACLERIEPRLEEPGICDLAQDLLEALPDFIDEPTGHVVERYARSPVEGVALPATRALPTTLGREARATLRALVEHKDEAVRIAAIRGLVRADVVDADAVAALAPTILGERRSSMKVRACAVEALGRPQKNPPALLACTTLLTRVVASTGWAESDDLVVIGATALLAIGGDATLVAERWRNGTPGLRARLEVLMKGARRQ